MTTHVGKEGLIEIGGTQIGELVNWSWEEVAGRADDGILEDNWETHKVTRLSWSGEIAVHYDPSDATQQLMRAGAEVTVNFKEVGTATGAIYWTGQATVENMGVEVTLDGITARSYSLAGQGEITDAVVP